MHLHAWQPAWDEHQVAQVRLLPSSGQNNVGPALAG